MKINEVLCLAQQAAEGKDNFKEGAVGSNGYGFVFKDLKTDIPFVTDIYINKYCELIENLKLSHFYSKKSKNFT